MLTLARAGDNMIAYFAKAPYTLKTCKGCLELNHESTVAAGGTVKGKFQFTLTTKARLLPMFSEKKEGASPSLPPDVVPKGLRAPGVAFSTAAGGCHIIRG